MLDTFLAVLGILVSFILFFIGYRQTVGAKKERIAACNTELEKILLRRIVLEGYTPTRIDIERLVEGKARDFRVHSDDLLSVAQILNSVYTRIVESDLIPAEQRHSITERITPTLAESEAKPVEDVERTLAERHRFLSATTAAVGVMAVLASTVGALITALPDLANLDTTQPTLFKTFLATAAASLAVITLFVVSYRIRASQEDVATKGTEVEQYVRFESLVASALRKLGFAIRPTPPSYLGDFLVERDGKKYVVEVKSWPRRVPTRVLAELAERLKRTAGEVGADEVLIVTQSPLLEAVGTLQIPGVQFLTVKELGTYLKQRRGGPNAA
jgi:HJR/Mrr/RecB family endonuclease